MGSKGAMMPSVIDGIMDPLERQKVLKSLGFRCLDFEYTQPPINEKQQLCRGLRLVVKGCESLPSEVIIAYLDGFAGSVCGWDCSWKAKPYYKDQLEQLKGRVCVEATAELPW